MQIPNNVSTVVRKAVAQQRAKDGSLPWDHDGVELVVDNSAIKIAELEAKIVDIAHNLNTTKDRVVEWSKDAGEALLLLDQTLARVEKLDAAIGIAQAYLSTAQNIPADQSTSGYVANALEVLTKV